MSPTVLLRSEVWCVEGCKSGPVICMEGCNPVLLYRWRPHSHRAVLRMVAPLALDTPKGCVTRHAAAEEVGDGELLVANLLETSFSGVAVRIVRLCWLCLRKLDMPRDYVSWDISRDADQCRGLLLRNEETGGGPIVSKLGIRRKGVEPAWFKDFLTFLLLRSVLCCLAINLTKSA